jgi:hypothetical protein
VRHRRFSSTLWRVTGLFVIGALGLLWRAARRSASVEPEPFPPVPPRPGPTNPRAADAGAEGPGAEDGGAAGPGAEDAGAEREPAPNSRPADLLEGATPPLAGTTPEAVSAAWVTPDPSGGCPAGFPVKVKLASGLYHEPGAAAYGRTRPDRCYRDAAAAQADGFRAARH